MGELIGDAVRALRAGLEEIMPTMGPWRHGVVFNDGDEPSSPDTERPLRKLERSYRVPEIPPDSTGAKDTP